ncbi:hypothetical protein CRYUN_Cryun26dG0127700 [Craigia yunnanensis]
MYKFCFPEKWVCLIMTCVPSVSYSVVANGYPCGRFNLTKGLTQGTLCHRTCSICVEGLLSLLRRAELDGRIKGLAISRSASEVTHLFFVDNSILFLQDSMGECEAITDVLCKLESASGQQINIDKSFIIFSANRPTERNEEMIRKLGVSRMLVKDRYLGLPIMIGK